ncbi:MAG TPA: hypothetical protein V6D22_03395 [Candidatus Obscuribacterales bacterium]
MSERQVFQDTQIINNELGPRNENQQLATQHLTGFVNEILREHQYRNPADGQREVQHLMHELSERGIAVQQQPGYMTDQFNRPLMDQYTNRPIPETKYVPFRQAPQYAEPYYGTPPIAPPGAVMPPPAIYMAPRECQGINLGLNIPLGNGIVGLNMPLLEQCRRDRDEWYRHHPQHHEEHRR